MSASGTTLTPSPTIASATASLKSTLSSDVTGASAAFLSWFATFLPQSASDEATIFGNALQFLSDQLASAANWEDALSATYNSFYNAEMTEEKKLVMAALETFAKIASGFAAAI